MQLISNLLSMILGGTVGITALLLLQTADDTNAPHIHGRCYQCRYFDKDCGACFRLTDYSARGQFEPLRVDRLEYCSKFERR